MQIFVTGGAGPATSYTVSPDVSVDELKSVIENVEFVPASAFGLVAGSGALTGSLASNGLVDGDSVTMCYEVAGGMRAKWRKKRMRRLRRKRRKMRQRAR
mmetsp:Transcript_28332/g.43692  ORF Transcript_28332/g.43692 Transcript_28332/m.43692 type:complete len:100 (-) Transcript_28332:50-349(-)